MIKAFGFVDVLAGFILFGVSYGLNFPHDMVIIISVILILKGLFFIKNFFSWIDIIIGLLLALSITSFIPIYILMVLSAFIFFKGLISFFMP